MMKKPINSSRCITIVGPSQSGKTSLLESILHICKQIPNKGQVSDDNTLSDHLPEEHNLKMSISMGISKAQFMDEDFTFIDCPGSSEFINEFLQAIRISDLSVVVIEPIKEKILSLVPYFFYLNKMNVPHILFINKVDNLNFDIKELLGTIQEYSSNPLVIRQIPIREGDKIIGAADVIHERAYTYTKDKPSQIVKIPDQLSSTRDEIREKVLETLADFDDALMEKILEDVPTSTEEIYEHLKKDIASNNIVEVLTGSAENETGIRRLLKTIRHDCPDHEKTVERNGLKINKDSACVQVFKTNFIPHRGKQSIVRVWSGELQEGATLQDSIRLQNLFSLKGKEFVKIAKAKGGDVIGLSRIESIKTGDLISDGNKKIDKDGDIPIPPQPIYSKAIRTIKREDDVKLSESLKEIIETDSSYSIERNAVTQQLLIWGQGEIHLRIALNKLKNNYNETKNKGIKPTPVIGGVGVLSDYKQILSMNLKNIGNLVLVIGKTEGHLEQSIFAKEILSEKKGPPPEINFFNEKNNGETILKLIEKNLIVSCHDISLGGILTSVSKMCIKGNKGIKINPLKSLINKFQYFFGEDQGRYIIELNKKNLDSVKKILDQNSVYFDYLGIVNDNKIIFNNDINLSVDELKNVNKTWLKIYMDH